MSGTLGAPNGTGSVGPGSISVIGSQIGTELTQLLMCDQIQPGYDPSYQICKAIYLFHPLGGKMVDSPIRMAQSQEREISVPAGPEGRLRDAFRRERRRLGADKHIANAARVARIYGVSALVVAEQGREGTPLDLDTLWKADIYFSVFDPLNTGGSIAPNQDPNSPNFQRPGDITVGGKTYHRSRICITQNEEPIYISYTNSAFGYVGRSVYQRALYPLKAFIWSMITDEMVTRKAGVLIVKAKAPGGIVDAIASSIAGMKRSMLKQAVTENVLTVGHEDAIESLNLMNIDGAHGAARKNILLNIAAAADMPAIIINNETFAEGFGEGTEDAKNVAGYVETVRKDMEPLYELFDLVTMHRAWNPEFFAAIREEFPEEYGGVKYETAFARWKNSFTAEWPSFLREPESEKSKAQKVKLDALVQTFQAVSPGLDPDNKAAITQWVADNLNEMRLMFTSPLVLDAEALIAHAEQSAEMAQQAAQQPAGAEP